MKRYWEEEEVSSDTVTQGFFLVPLIVSFHVRKTYMSNVNFCNLCLKRCMEKKKPVGPRFYWNLTSSIRVYCKSNVKSHGGWSIFLSHVSGNECSKKVSENLEMVKFFVGKNFSSEIIFVGINYLSVNIFVIWRKIRHFLPTKFLPIR